MAAACGDDEPAVTDAAAAAAIELLPLRLPWCMTTYPVLDNAATRRGQAGGATAPMASASPC